MTVQELIEELEVYKELHGEDVEIRFASQPSWPFEYSIGEIVSNKDCPDMCDDESDEYSTDEQNTDTILYLVEERQVGYLPGNVKNQIGW